MKIVFYRPHEDFPMRPFPPRIRFAVVAKKLLLGLGRPFLRSRDRRSSFFSQDP